jgi:hypothetical protein
MFIITQVPHATHTQGHLRLLLIIFACGTCSTVALVKLSYSTDLKVETHSKECGVRKHSARYCWVFVLRR